MNTGKHRVVIVGGGYAGLMAAARIGRENGAQVTLVDAQPTFTHRIRLHETLAGSATKTFAYARSLARRNVDFTQAYVDALHPAQGRISGRTTAGTPLDLGYDTLILALGSRTAASVPGVEQHSIRLDDTPTLQRTVPQIAALAERGGTILVVGGGLTAIETATELAERYPTVRVTLAFGGNLHNTFSANAAQHLAQTLARLNIVVREHTRIVGVEAGAAWCADGSALPFDLCVWCGGFAAPTLARNAGLPVDESGRVLVDATLRVPDHANIFAVGDAAAASVNGAALRMGCGTAFALGTYAGEAVRRSLRGQEVAPFGFKFAARCISLGRSDGLVQWTDGADAPRDAVWTQRRAIYMKEAIGRLTYSVVRNELRTGLRLYTWPGRN